ncbi:MAG: hypothetical protein ACXAB8_03195 [Promethearchaeota archaeon]
MLVIGYILENLVVRRDLGVFNPLVNVLFYIGVLFHEISHYTLCLLTGVRPGRISVRLRSEETGRVAPHGFVKTEKPYQKSFLQSVLISFGPVLVGTWIMYFSLNIAFSSLFHPIYRVTAGFLAFSILLASTPSPPDFRLMIKGFGRDPRHSFYQLLLLILSFLMAWGVVIFFHIVFPIEFFYYFIIIAWYIVLKYSFIGIRWVSNRIYMQFGREQYRTRFRRFSGRKYKSSKFK